MSIRRTVPNVRSNEPGKSHAFYVSFLGMNVAMAREEIVTFASSRNPTAQISVIREDDAGAPHPDISVEVGNVDDMHARAVEHGIDIAYPLTDEPWGVRRFFVRDPNGAVINILSHR